MPDGHQQPDDPNSGRPFAPGEDALNLRHDSRHKGPGGLTQSGASSIGQTGIVILVIKSFFLSPDSLEQGQGQLVSIQVKLLFLLNKFDFSGVKARSRHYNEWNKVVQQVQHCLCTVLSHGTESVRFNGR